MRHNRCGGEIMHGFHHDGPFSLPAPGPYMYCERCLAYTFHLGIHNLDVPFPPAGDRDAHLARWRAGYDESASYTRTTPAAAALRAVRAQTIRSNGDGITDFQRVELIRAIIDKAGAA